MGKAHDLVDTLRIMGERGATHEQRRYVADALAGNPTSGSLRPLIVYPTQNRVTAVSDTGVFHDIHYPPALTNTGGTK
jgi:hypothetical protein